MTVSIPEVYYVNFTVPDGTPPAEAKQMALKMLAEKDWDSLDYSHTDENLDNFLIDGKEVERWENYGDSNDELPFGE